MSQRSPCYKNKCPLHFSRLRSCGHNPVAKWFDFGPVFLKLLTFANGVTGIKDNLPSVTFDCQGKW